MGGIFIKDGALNVYIADPADTVTAKRVIETQLSRQKRDLPIRFLRGKFNYCELYGYMEKIGRADHGSVGVSMTGIDDWSNRLLIGVVNEDARARILRIMDEERIPRDAVRVELIPYVKITLQPSHHVDA